MGRLVPFLTFKSFLCIVVLAHITFRQNAFTSYKRPGTYILTKRVPYENMYDFVKNK